MGTFPSIFSMGPNSHIRAHKKDSELMEVGSVFNNCFNVNFLMIPFCYCQFLESKCENQARGNELTTGPRIFMAKVNLVIKNQTGRTGVNWHRINKI